MQKGSKTKRKYKCSDATLIERATVFSNLVENDLGIFNSFDNTFDAAFVLQLNNDVQVCLNNGFDQTYRSRQRQNAKETNKVLKQCCIKYRQIKYFVGRAFPKDKISSNMFGTQEYKKAINNRSLMVEFMDVLHAMVSLHKAQLMAHGLTQLQIDEIKVLGDKLLETFSHQIIYSRARLTTSQKRIVLLNALYSKIDKICKAGKVINYDNSARQKMYTF